MKPYKLQPDLFEPNRFTLLIWDACTLDWEERAEMVQFPNKIWNVRANPKRNDYLQVSQILSYLPMPAGTAEYAAERLWNDVFRTLRISIPRVQKPLEPTLSLF